MGSYGLSFVPAPQPNSYVEALTSNATVFRDEAFKEVTVVKWGRKWERPNPTGHQSALLLPMCLHRERSCEDPERRQPSTRQEERLLQKLTLLVLWYVNCILQNCKKNKRLLVKSPRLSYLIMVPSPPLVTNKRNLFLELFWVNEGMTELSLCNSQWNNGFKQWLLKTGEKVKSWGELYNGWIRLRAPGFSD